ncbi:MAG: diguanylate cyclase [Spirochaetota bacterium]|nr:diguanylate cyclase [Spirochaetota bacterium]
MIKLNLQSRLMISYSFIIIMTGIAAITIGVIIINKGVINQAQVKVQNDLNTAREVLNNRVKSIKQTVFFLSLRYCIKNALIRNDRTLLKKHIQRHLREISKVDNIEILTVTDSKGTVIFRSSNPACYGDSQAGDPIINRILSTKRPAASIEIVNASKLKKEGDTFADRAYTKYVKTPKARKTYRYYETSGLMIIAAIPIYSINGELLGIVYGGDLINRNYQLVDKIKDIVYRGERYNNIDIGTATIFQKDLRVSTNVLTIDGERAIGTRVSEEVYNKVLEQGKQWIDRAFVVNSWYITAYEPIRNINNQIIGILYVGMLENKYVDLRTNTILSLVVITIMAMIIAISVSHIFAKRITNPIKYLVHVSKKISGGDFSVNVKVKSVGELGELEDNFNLMALALEKRNEELTNAFNKLNEIARTDPLTGIPNRRTFIEKASLEIHRAQRYFHPFSIAYLDIDNFKNINDSFGHNTGDALICLVADTIKNNIREIDEIARLGGDEFVILLSQTDSKIAYSVVNKLKTILSEIMKENKWPVTFSIGIVTFIKPPISVDNAIAKADSIMYSAKQEGKDLIKAIEVDV